MFSNFVSGQGQERGKFINSSSTLRYSSSVCCSPSLHTKEGEREGGSHHIQTMHTCAPILLAVLVLVVGSVMAEDISFDRVHLVDAQIGGSSEGVANSFLFRGNAPLETLPNGTVQFAYDTALTYMRERATAANYSFPTNNSRVYLIDISFESIMDGYYMNELLFWKDATNSNKGRYEEWLLIGAVAWATDFTTAEQQEMIGNGSVWKLDQIPLRIQRARSLLLEGPPQGYDALAVYVHCAGGCDRTGEFIASYRLNFYHTLQLLPIYSADVEECGRAPDYFASGAIGWYCLTWNYFNASALQLPPVTDCLDAYTCSLFGSCNATGL